MAGASVTVARATPQNGRARRPIHEDPLDRSVLRLASPLLHGSAILEERHGADGVTVEILKGIRDEVRGVREDLGAEVRRVREDLGARLDETNARLDETNTRLDRLERRQTESEMRVATQLVAVVGAVNEVRDAVREELGVRKQVEDHEQRLRELESREH